MSQVLTTFDTSIQIIITQSYITAIRMKPEKKHLLYNFERMISHFQCFLHCCDQKTPRPAKKPGGSPRGRQSCFRSHQEFSKQSFVVGGKGKADLVIGTYFGWHRQNKKQLCLYQIKWIDEPKVPNPPKSKCLGRSQIRQKQAKVSQAKQAKHRTDRSKQ